MKIVLCVNSLVQGGAQRFTVDFARELVNLGYQVDLITFYPEESDFFVVPEKVRVVRFLHPFQFHKEKRKVSARVLKNRLVRAYYRLLDLRGLRKCVLEANPDIVIAVERYVGVLIGISLPGKVRILISDRVHPGYHEMTRIIGKLDKFLVKWIYRKKNVFLHAQGQSISKYIHSEFGKPVFTIPNFVNPDIQILERERDARIVLAVGRFANQKGLDLLVKAWGEINHQIRDDWQLHIHGDGNREEIEQLVSKTNCKESIRLFGPTKTAAELYEKASIFILPSRYEGFPNALAEAMASGLPCIATDSPSAVRDLTRKGELARLVDISIVDLTGALTEFMTNNRIREEYAVAALQVRELFSYQNIMPIWEDLLKSIIRSNSSEPRECPVCLNSLSDKDVLEVQTEMQILSDLKTSWKINFEGVINRETKFILRYQCKRCGVQSFNAPPGDQGFYSACHKSEKYERITAWDYQRLMHKLSVGESSSSGIKEFLDVGSGKSKLVNLLPNSKESLDIIELDSKILKDQVSKVRNAYSTIEDVNNRYDVIVMSHFLEHIQDPVQVISRIEQLCKPNAILVITVPDALSSEKFESALDWPPHHTYRFTENSLINLVENFSFKFERTEREYEEEGDRFDFSAYFRFRGN